MKHIVNDQVVLSRPLEGPLAAPIALFAQWVREQGYALYSLHRQVLLAAGFSRWLGHKGVAAQDVASDHPAQYLRHRARRLCIGRGDASALKRFMAFLRREGIIAEEKTAPCSTTPVEQCVEGFERYLRDERVLTRATIINYLPFIRCLLGERFADRRVELGALCACDIAGFVRRQASQMRGKRAKLMTAALRSFLHYARYRGDITADLAAAVPVVAGWSMSSIPRAIPADEVRKLLARVSRRTAMGRRDYAILLLLARLGLRASEVAFLDLDDMDWTAGRLRVRTKGGRYSELPLPAELGEAIVAYLQHGRPRSTSRRVFLRAKAPIRGFRGPSAISSIVCHALARAGIDAPTKGAHQFRHALATQLLRHGASLTEIGELLGHRSPETTKIYAKVDLDALRALALPWPGGVR